jgi:hypothetical protein
MKLPFDHLTRMAITHTRHCLVGCGIGEILGSAIGAHWRWPNIWQTALAVGLAFVFGYGLTFWGARRAGSTTGQAARTAFATDTISITSMEIIDNAFVWLIPGAMNAHPGQGLFWWSLALSLALAFVVTVPVNRFWMARSGQHHHGH